MAKKLSVLKPWRFKKLKFFLIAIVKVQYLTLTKTCPEKDLSVIQTLIAERKPNLKVLSLVFNYQTMFSFCLLFCIL